MVRFSAVEKVIMDEALDPEVLKDHVPEMGEVLEGAAMLRNMMSETNTLGKFQKAYGFSGTGNMQRIAKITPDVRDALEELHTMGCDCTNPVFGNGGHKEWFYEWLNKHGQAFDVRGKVVP